MDDQFWLEASRQATLQSARDSLVRVRPSVYDHEARGDFDHDPVRDHEWCDGCATLLRHALNRIGDRHMGPRSADDLVAAIREELEP
jgi:hypothetical protein